MSDKVRNTSWGSEVLWADTKHYKASLLYIKSGHTLRGLYDPWAHGSYLVNRGRVKYKWNDNDGTGPRTVVMCTGEHVTVTGGTNYSFEALDCACIIKITT